MSSSTTTVSQNIYGLTPDGFRQVMGALPTGITVVTTNDPNGVAVGLTVNACTSVSLDPPQLLVCLKNDSYTLEAINQSSFFAVNILEGSQDFLARRFAMPRSDKFHGIQFEVGETGVPILPGVLAYAECKVAKSVAAGDHTVVIGRALAGGAGQSDPLVYFRRCFGPLDRFEGQEQLVDGVAWWG